MSPSPSVPPPFTLLRLPRTDSTNRVALEAARAGAPHGLVVLADDQSAGRGRQGRSFHSSPGASLTLSIVCRPGLPASALWPYTLLGGLAVRAAALCIAEGRSPRCWMKWPNDVYLDERKAAGVLCELVSDGPTVSAVVVGIGVNLSVPTGGWPAELASLAGSLDGVGGKGADRDVVLTALLRAFGEREAELLTSGPSTLLAEADAAMAPMWGRFVSIERTRDRVRARVLGLAQNGALRLQSDEGNAPFEVLAGDVHLLPHEP